MFSCKVCEIKDQIIAKLEAKENKPCPICETKDAMIKNLVEQISFKDGQIAEYKREWKRAMDRILEKNGIPPVREEAAGQREFDIASMMNVFNEVPIGKDKDADTF